MIKEEKQEILICPQCGLNFDSKRKLSKHKEKHKREENKKYGVKPKPVFCEECNEEFSTQNLYWTHAFKVHDKGVVFCEVCCMKLMKWRYKRHLASHSEKSLQCPKCESLFRAEYQLKKHLTTYHPEKYKFNCEQCGKGFMLKTSFEHHMNIHLGLKPYVCDICACGFSDKSNLHAHRKKVHKHYILGK